MKSPLVRDRNFYRTFFRLTSVIANTPALIIALILVIPMAVLGMRLAEKVLKKQAAALR